MTADTSGQLQLATGASATTAITVDTSQNVGIGTTSPGGKVQANAGSAQVALMAGGTVTNPQYPAFGFDGQVFSNGGRGAGMYLPADGTLAWATVATERMRIDSSGNVGIGTTTPGAKLGITAGTLGTTAGSQIKYQILGSSDVSNNDFLEITNTRETAGSSYIGAGSRLQQKVDVSYMGYVQFNGGVGTTNDLGISFGTGINASATGVPERMRIDFAGNVLVGTTAADAASGVGFKYIQNGTNPYLAMVVSSTSGSNNYHLYSTGASAFRFFVSSAGAINATSTSITAISDVSLKENIRDLETGLTEVMALRPRRFDWKEETKLPEKNNAGFIAQEVEQVLPELVYDYQYDTDTTKKALKMGDILPTLVKAIQEQQAIINDLKARIETLEAK